MKKDKIIYWSVTILFSGFMIFSAVPDVMSAPEAKVFMNHLGYPDYIIPFLGVAKILGVIAILIPGFPRIHEWAYAGLFFDLLGATYSNMAKDGFDPSMLIMILPFAFLFISRFYSQRIAGMKKEKTA
ncbi:MAG TPA: DoxX family protein [Bacteroidia bacterium]|nr:DoxX family protein [Bacteroidia bacterium]